MRLASTEMEAEKGGKKDFSKARTLLEGIKRRAAIVTAALALSVSTIHCGGDPGPTDGGTGGDGGTVTDGGHDSGGDGGMDGGVTGLCAQYPDGHPNRTVFTAPDNVRVPGENTLGLRLFMYQIKNEGGWSVTLGFYNESSPGSPPDYTGLFDGQTRSKTIPTFGTITMQACSITQAACLINGPQGTISGDSSCSAVIAADRPWGP